MNDDARASELQLAGEVMTAPSVGEALDAALGYAALGMRLIPLHPIVDGTCPCAKPKCEMPGKHPMLKKWPSRATSNVRAANIEFGRSARGIGAVAGKGIVCLDIDPKKGGHDALADLQRTHGLLPRTTRVLTGLYRDTRGVHLWFRFPRDIQVQSRNDIPLPGIDVKGDGGYAVLPPTVHKSGVRYEVDVSFEEMAEMPTWLLALLKKERVPREKGGGDRERTGLPLSAKSRNWLKNGIPLLGTQRLNLCRLARAVLECDREAPYSVGKTTDMLWTALLISDWSGEDWTYDEVEELVRSIDGDERQVLLNRRQAPVVIGFSGRRTR